VLTDIGYELYVLGAQIKSFSAMIMKVMLPGDIALLRQDEVTNQMPFVSAKNSFCGQCFI